MKLDDIKSLKISASLSKNEMSIFWSLKPLVIFMKICGVPIYFETENNKSCTINRLLVNFLWRSLSLVCLLLNCFFQTYNFVYEMKFAFLCSPPSFFYWKLIPFDFMEYAQKCLEPIFITGVPLVFAFKFYFTQNFQMIWSSILKLDERVLLFY